MREKLTSLEILRGLAALAVGCFHFAGQIPEADLWSQICRFGHYGVEVFFVISGFVILLSLARRAEKGPVVKQFLIGRFWRLYPAFVVTLFGSMLVWWALTRVSANLREPFEYSTPRLMKNLSLSAGLFGGGWYLSVFWTLGLEAQFYLLLIGVYRFLDRAFSWIGAAILAVCSLAPLYLGRGVDTEFCHFFNYSSVFVVGLGAFRFFRFGTRDKLGWVAMLLCLPSIQIVHGVGSLAAALFCFLGIVFFPSVESRPLQWLGQISYSFYLVHLFVGTRIVNFLKARSQGSLPPIATSAAAIAASLFAAWLLYLLVERPSLRLANRFSKRSAKPVPANAA